MVVLRDAKSIFINVNFEFNFEICLYRMTVIRTRGIVSPANIPIIACFKALLGKTLLQHIYYSVLTLFWLEYPWIPSLCIFLLAGRYLISQ